MALAGQGIGQGGGASQQGLGIRVLGIEHPQGVGADAILGIGIELVVVGLQPAHQFRPVALTILGGAQGIDLQFQAAHPQIGQQVPGDRDRLRITTGIGHPEQLHADLVELAPSPLLRPFVAEHRPAIPEPLRALRKQSVLNRRPHHRGGPLRPQGATALAAVEEGVHLLADNIGGLTDAALEQLGGLQ